MDSSRPLPSEDSRPQQSTPRETLAAIGRLVHMASAGGGVGWTLGPSCAELVNPVELERVEVDVRAERRAEALGRPSATAPAVEEAAPASAGSRGALVRRPRGGDRRETRSPLRSEIDQLGDLLPVIRGIAERELRRLGALEIEVEVVLPGEADAAVELNPRASHPAEGV